MKERFSFQKAVLTIQVLLLRAHDFVSGGLAHCFRHGGSRYTVLSRGYPVRNALPRHLLLPRRSDKKRIQSFARARPRV